MDVINPGDVVVVQRLNYMRTFKIAAASKKARNGDSGGKDAAVQTMQLGKEKVDVSAVLGCPFGSAFRMRKDAGGARVWRLERVARATAEAAAEGMLGKGDDEQEGSKQEEQGQDNRHLQDRNSSQKLSRDTIEAMKEDGAIGAQMVSSLVYNSDTFQQKTRFSQAKFLRKKTDKYFDFLVFRRPSLRLLMDIQYRVDPQKILNLRVDSLAQLLNQACVRSGGRYLVYETGCQGLVVAAALERVGAAPGGKVVHLFQTGNPQTQSVSAMNFAPEVAANLTTLNMYHLRSLEQGQDITQMHRKPEEGEEGKSNGEKDNGVEDGAAREPAETASVPVPYRQRLREQSVASHRLMSECGGMDGLIVACRQHPTAILQSLLRYLAPSRPFAVFSPYKEPLMDAYVSLKEGGRALNVTLSESWLRRHQVLPGRTHPEVNMSGGGGYVLSGIRVDNAEPEGQPFVDEEGAKGKSKRARRSR